MINPEHDIYIVCIEGAFLVCTSVLVGSCLKHKRYSECFFNIIVVAFNAVSITVAITAIFR